MCFDEPEHVLRWIFYSQSHRNIVHTHAVAWSRDVRRNLCGIVFGWTIPTMCNCNFGTINIGLGGPSQHPRSNQNIFDLTSSCETSSQRYFTFISLIIQSPPISYGQSRREANELRIKENIETWLTLKRYVLFHSFVTSKQVTYTISFSPSLPLCIIYSLTLHSVRLFAIVFNIVSIFIHQFVANWNSRNEIQRQVLAPVCTMYIFHAMRKQNGKSAQTDGIRRCGNPKMKKKTNSLQFTHDKTHLV